MRDLYRNALGDWPYAQAQRLSDYPVSSQIEAMERFSPRTAKLKRLERLRSISEAAREAYSRPKPSQGVYVDPVHGERPVEPGDFIRMDRLGRVGVGTSAPSAKIDVQKSPEWVGVAMTLQSMARSRMRDMHWRKKSRKRWDDAWWRRYREKKDQVIQDIAAAFGIEP